MTGAALKYEVRRTKYKRRRWLVSLFSYFVLGTSYLSAADAGSVEDVQDVLFFHDSRPVLIRLHIRVDGKPYPARWNEYLQRWFRFLDQNEDGFLDRKEALRAPPPRLLEELFSNPFTYQSAAPLEFEGFDRDYDKKISLVEFLHYYRHSQAGPVRVASPFRLSVQIFPQQALTEALTTLLDTNKDGKLARAELENAEQALRRFDQDDDELVSLQELQTAALPPHPGSGLSRQLLPALQAPAIPVIALPREDTPRRIDVRLPVAREVIKHYDKNKNQTLGRDEISMAKHQFDRLDANKDGQLDLSELLRWMIAIPDAEAVVRLGRIDTNQEAIESVAAQIPLRALKVRNALAYSTPEHCVNLIAAPGVPIPSMQAARRVIVRQFQTIDQKNRGFLTRKQLPRQQFYYLYSIQEVADRDGDQCLDLEELQDWLDMTTSGIGCQISIALAASGRGLFSVLDADQDGRLSLRELRYAWKRVSLYDRDKDGALAREEVPVQYQVVMNPGAPNYRAGQFGDFQPPPPDKRIVTLPRGPLWFHKMDRNGDGDVSQREFLGSRNDFRRFDTDGDRLISVEEAIRADAAHRKK